MSRRRRLAVAVGALSLLAVAGLFEWSARRLVRAPGAVRPPVRTATPEGARALRIPVGPPAATLDVWVFDPDGSARGTILAFHGLWDDKRSRVGFARELAREGARVALVDQRAHGASTGRRLYFGGVEGRDAAQVLDALEARGLLAEPVAVHGASYGGAVAHQLAGRDPRVGAVVSVASFADLRGLMRAYAEMSWPRIAWAIPDLGLELFARRAAAHGGIDLAETDVVPAVRASDAEVLLFHGDADEVVPFSQARRIAGACAARGCELVRLRGMGHDAAMRDPGTRRRGLAFLREHLARE